VRAVLGASSYEEACRISRAAYGRAVSRQLFGILPKIRELDALQSPALQQQLFEMHPEVSFAELAGAPMQFHKATSEGRHERLAALRRAFPDLRAVSDVRPRGTQPDDVLDALVGAWTARRYASGLHTRLGGDVDARGLRMEIIV
jgi:predicted RNase H-like nuclease